MALNAGEIAGVEVWTGPIASDDFPSLEERIDRLGSLRVAALEILSIRLSGFLSEPLRMRLDGDVTWESDRNVKALEAKIGQLATICAGETGLTPAAEELIASAAGLAEPGKTVRAVDYNFSHHRTGHGSY